MAKYALDEIISIPVNGDTQYLHLRSTSEKNPVLLFVHGGPGTCDRTWVMPKQSPYLADACIMVCWDQRMAGKSYKKADADKEMTLDEGRRGHARCCHVLKGEIPPGKDLHSWTQLGNDSLLSVSPEVS